MKILWEAEGGRTHMYATEQIHVINCQSLLPCHWSMVETPLAVWARRTTHHSNPHNLRSSVVCKTAREGAELLTSKTETSVPSNLTATFISAKKPSEAIINSRPSFLDRCARSESMARCSCGILLSCMPSVSNANGKRQGKTVSHGYDYGKLGNL